MGSQQGLQLALQLEARTGLQCLTDGTVRAVLLPQGVRLLENLRHHSIQ